MTREEVLKIAKPILFNTRMVRVIQDGTKTVTRRIVKPQPDSVNDIIYKHSAYDKWFISPDDPDDPEIEVKPSYKVGDILYVRETWGRMSVNECDDIDCTQYCKDMGFCYKYKVDGDDKSRISEGWFPSIHMPKEAARYFLRVTSVCAEKLQDMTFDDFLSEGIVLRPEAFNDPDNAYYQAKEQYEALWNSTVKKSDLDKYGWNANPGVWVIEFERMEVTA